MKGDQHRWPCGCRTVCLTETPAPKGRQSIRVLDTCPAHRGGIQPATVVKGKAYHIDGDPEHYGAKPLKER
jgi:hypothetical protein